MPSTGLLGRTGPLSLLHAAAERASEGDAQLVTVRGDAGIGKSTLLDAAVDELRRGGATVVQVALSSVESQLGWAGLRLLCDQVAADVERLPADARATLRDATGRGVEVDADAGRVAFALAELFTQLSEPALFVLVVDDLHWLDGATAAALAFAVRTTQRRRILTVMAHRPVELPLDPARLVPAAHQRSVELDGLSVAGVHRLLREHAGVRLGRPDAIRIHAVTAGSPLHTLEIGRLLSAGTALDDALVHPSAYDVMLSRVRRYPAATRQVLLAAALSAEPTLSRVGAALPDLDVVDAVGMASEDGIADLRGATIEFVHPLARAAVVAEATGATRRQVQARLAEVASDPDERVLLMEAAAEGLDAALASALDDAAARAADRGDLPVAARLARAAVDRTPIDDVAARVSRLLDAADLATASGDLQVPVELADAAVALDPSPAVRFRAGVTKALALGNRDEVDATLALLDDLLVQLDGDPGCCARIHDIRAQALMRSDMGAALAAARSALAFAVELGDPDAVDREQSLLDLMSVLAGEPVDLAEVEVRCDRLALTGTARDWSVSVLNSCDLAAASLRHNLLQVEEYQRLGLVHYEAPTRSRILADLIVLGRYREALDEAAACLDLHEMIGGLISTPIHADVAFLTHLLGHDRRAAEARRLATAEVLASAGNIDDVGAMGRLTQLAVVRGDWEDAVGWAARARALSDRIGFTRSGVIPYRVDGLEAHVHLGRLEEAATLLDELEAINDRAGMPRGPADSARCRALLAAGRGELDEAVALGQRASAAYRSIDFPLEAARAEQFVGATLRRAGRRSEAADHLRQARLEFEKLEAPTLVARVDEQIERLGVRRSGGDTELTPSERQIADLVVQGRSNAEIAATMMVSVRTVESNLTKAYRKLGVKSRTELVAALRSR